MFTMNGTEDFGSVKTVLEITRSGKNKLIFEIECREPGNDWSDTEIVAAIFDRGQIEKLHTQLTAWLATPKAPVYKGKVSGKI